MEAPPPPIPADKVFTTGEQVVAAVQGNDELKSFIIIKRPDRTARNKILEEINAGHRPSTS